MSARPDPILADLLKLIGTDAYLHITYRAGEWEICWGDGVVTAPELNDAINAAIEQQHEVDLLARREDTREYERDERREW
jgi:hypothetical protein